MKDIIKRNIKPLIPSKNETKKPQHFQWDKHKDLNWSQEAEYIHSDDSETITEYLSFSSCD